MPKVMLGYALVDAPEFYKNFILAHSHRSLKPIRSDRINYLLSKEPCKVVLRRKRRGDPEDGFVYLMSERRKVPRTEYWGQWYLDFSSKKDELAFRLRWA